MNVRMADLKKCFEKLGLKDVKTVLSSGNVVFTDAESLDTSLARTLEAGMPRHLRRSFPVIVRKVDDLLALLKSDPFSGFRIPSGAKRVVTFLGHPHRAAVSLPIELDGVQILCMNSTEVFTAYLPNERGPVFMTLIEKTFGKNVTTRTWGTIDKCTKV